jgi:CBS domain containing-hemolysin-like protein
MEWLADPTIWVGLLTLILLEIVLGIDNLIFIAVLADKLPPHQRDRARLIGLGLALLMRLALLASISWLVTLTQPLFTLFALEFSGRDLILLVGGLFLLFKATMEIHERLEGNQEEKTGSTVYAGFWTVVTQIIVLDAVFSLDSVITAVGMVDELGVMMAAVVIAMIVMIVASKPLTQFVNAHPTVVMLCLGFLLMIGFSLIAEGFDFHIPKGYLYAAIGFSVLIEAFNQIGRVNRQRAQAKIPLRERTADAVLRLLGGRPGPGIAAAAQDPKMPPVDTEDEVFAASEKEMIRGVLRLADREVRTIMTPRPDLVWIDLDDPREEALREVRASGYSRLVACRGSIDEVAGIVRKKDLLDQNLDGEPLDVATALRQPLVVHEGASILETLELFKKTPVHMAIVVDEYGSLQGLVTQTDILEAITGDLPGFADDGEPEVERREDGSVVIDGKMPADEVQDLLGLRELPDEDYATLAGFVLFQLGRIPEAGESVNWSGWRFEVVKMDGRRIDRIRAWPAGDDVGDEPIVGAPPDAAPRAAEYR